LKPDAQAKEVEVQNIQRFSRSSLACQASISFFNGLLKGDENIPRTVQLSRLLGDRLMFALISRFLVSGKALARIIHDLATKWPPRASKWLD
jgi:hypothetical protein